MNTTLSPVTIQRLSALQSELIGLVELDYTGLTPKLEQIIRAFEFTQIKLAVYRDRNYAQGRGVGQPEADLTLKANTDDMREASTKTCWPPAPR